MALRHQIACPDYRPSPDRLRVEDQIEQPVRGSAPPALLFTGKENHILNTPNFVSATGALRAAESDSPGASLSRAAMTFCIVPGFGKYSVGLSDSATLRSIAASVRSRKSKPGAGGRNRQFHRKRFRNRSSSNRKGCLSRARHGLQADDVDSGHMAKGACRMPEIIEGGEFKGGIGQIRQAARPACRRTLPGKTGGGLQTSFKTAVKALRARPGNAGNPRC